MEHLFACPTSLERFWATFICIHGCGVHMPKLVCGVCGSEMEMPIHCGRPMKALETGGAIELLVCDACGYETEPPKHHDTVMKLKQ